MKIPKDFADLLTAFDACGVEYMVVGGYAVGHHGVPRATKDLDLFVSGGDNLARVAAALASFGLPSSIADRARSLGDSEVLWFGKPPLRVDLLRSITGVSFEEAYPRAETVVLEGTPVKIIGRADLLANKRAAGRPQDLADAARLGDRGRAGDDSV